MQDDRVMDPEKSEKSLYGLAAGYSGELSQDEDSLITSQENSFIRNENNLQGNLSSSLSTSFLACRNEKSVALDHLLDKTDLLLEKPEQISNEPDLLQCHSPKSQRRAQDSNKSERNISSEGERKLDFVRKSLNSDTVIQSVQAVFQEWCTHSTFEYLGLAVKPKVASAPPEAKDKGKHFSLIIRRQV